MWRVSFYRNENVAMVITPIFAGNYLQRKELFACSESLGRYFVTQTYHRSVVSDIFCSKINTLEYQ